MVQSISDHFQGRSAATQILRKINKEEPVRPAHQALILATLLKKVVNDPDVLINIDMNHPLLIPGYGELGIETTHTPNLTDPAIAKMAISEIGKVIENYAIAFSKIMHESAHILKPAVFALHKAALFLEDMEQARKAKESRNISAKEGAVHFYCPNPILTLNIAAEILRSVGNGFKARSDQQLTTRTDLDPLHNHEGFFQKTIQDFPLGQTTPEKIFLACQTLSKLSVALDAAKLESIRTGMSKEHTLNQEERAVMYVLGRYIRPYKDEKTYAQTPDFLERTECSIVNLYPRP